MSVSADSFEADVLDSHIPVLVDFWAPWCPPCRAVAPVLDQIAADYDGRLKVMKVNIDEEPSIAEAQHRRGLDGHHRLRRHALRR